MGAHMVPAGHDAAGRVDGGQFGHHPVGEGLRPVEDPGRVPARPGVSGRWIVQHGLPTHDALTVLSHGHRWIDQQWLAQLALYGLWRLAGVKLVLFVHALLVTSGLVGSALFG